MNLSHPKRLIPGLLLAVIVLMSAACSPTVSPEKIEPFPAGQFSNPTRIDNGWFPLTPGSELTFTGFTVSEGNKLDHKVVFTVTDLIKEISGVQTVVVWERDFSAGELAEAELVFFAQADDGTVWSLGQYPEEYENGKIIDNPAWIHGIEKAQAGIAMLADPKVGGSDYSQGWGPGVEYTDRGTVAQDGQQVCVPLDCFEDVLIISETSALEKNAAQLKYYARGIGNIRVSFTGADQTQETLQLVSFRQLDAAAMKSVQAEALKLEASAYKNSPDVYANTTPAVPATADN